MVATATSRRLTTARCLLASEACSTSRVTVNDLIGRILDIGRG